MKIIEGLSQNSESWHKWRRSGLGGSDISICAGINPYKSKKDLFFEKSDLAGTSYVNEAMIRGSVYEAQARKHVVDKHGMVFDPICVESEVNPIWRASLDGYNRDDRVILEIKIPGPKGWEEAKKGVIPAYYLAQIQWQLMISDAVKCYYVVYNPDLDESHYQLVYPCAESQKALQEAAIEFWEAFEKGIVLYDLPTLEDENLKDLIASYDTLKVEEKKIEKGLKNLSDQIKQANEGKPFRAYGYALSEQKGRVSYDYKAMESDGIDLTKYLKQGEPSLVLRKEKP